MSSKSFRRVLGETHLERKCRLLFGLCLAVLMMGAFSWVFVIAKQLVIRTTRSQAADLVDAVMLKKHWVWWVTNNERGTKDLVAALTDDFKKKETFEPEILTLDESISITNVKARRPTDELELEILRQLDRELREHLAKKTEPTNPPNEAQLPTNPANGPTNLPKLFKEQVLPEQGTYVYYQPLIWSRNCSSACHRLTTEFSLPSTLDERPTVDAAPLHVIKVTVPYSETRAAVDETWAILVAAAIVTVMVAMLALYIIVRYVVVKPLKHLRAVSEEVQQGNLSLRADIHTSDEFEDLADSFNRMLRHLVESQDLLRSVNGELEGRMDQLARMNVQLHEMNRIKSEFLANMSHELRTPLNSIIGFSDVLQGIDALNDKQKRYVQNIQKSGRVLLDMINDILDLAKLESNRMEVRPVEMHIESVVAAQCDMMRSLSEEKNIDLDSEIPPNLPPMFHDQGKIQQVLNNLLSNAIKFTPEGGRVRVSVQRNERERLVLTVTDTGVGIAESDREIIFEKFRQGSVSLGRDNLSREFSGTGLGLSIVKELCKLLGGEVVVESELGTGSTFTVTLPWEYNRSPARRD